MLVIITIFHFVTVLYYTRIHNGHRLLLSTSCLLTNSRIVVGVSDENLLVNKTLGELIEPLEVRMRNVAEFIEDIKPGRWGGGGGRVQCGAGQFPYQIQFWAFDSSLTAHLGNF